MNQILSNKIDNEINQYLFPLITKASISIHTTFKNIFCPTP